MKPIASSSERSRLREFSDQEIIALQDIFMTNGIHEITITDRAHGRDMINTFVTALNCHHTLAWLTCEQAPVEPECTDVYAMLSSSGMINGQTIFDFLLDGFYADLLVIENSKQLLSQPWLSEFYQQLQEFGLDRSIPIVSLSYRNTSPKTDV